MSLSPGSKNFLYKYRGVLWLLFAEFIASLMALMTRYLETSLPKGKTLHPFQIISWRMSIALAGCLLLGWLKRVPHYPFGREGLRFTLILRGLGGFVGVCGFYYALAGLPLPDATVISFLVPTLVGIACAILPALREPFTKIEMISALIAFVGVILIARPSFLKPAIPWLYHDLNVADSTGNLSRAAAVAIALMGICGTSTAYTCLRCIGTRADPLIPVTYFVGFSGLISTVCLVAIPSLPNFMLPTGGFEWALTLGLGFGGFVMQWCLTKGLQTEKGSTGSQIIYVQLVFAVLWELIVWGDLPSIPSLFGILFIIVGIAIANVYKEILPEKEAPDDIIPEEESALLG